MTQKKDRAAVGMIALAMFIWGTIGLLRRLVPLSSGLIACFRGFSGALFLLIFMKARHIRILAPIPRKKLLLLLLSGAVMGVNWILLFEAYNYTTVPIATLCYYMAPTLVILASPLVLGEKLKLRRGICAAVALLGMVLVSGVVQGGLPAAGELQGILLGLGAAVLYASVVLLNKALTGIEPFRKTVLQLLAAAVTVLPYVLFTEGLPETLLDAGGLVALIVMGLLHTGVAYALYFGSIPRVSAGTAAVFSYVDPVTALVISALFLGESLTIPGIVGAVLILGAAYLGEKS